MATTTPWGASQSADRLVRGIMSYTTARHGGLKVGKKLNELVPFYMRHKDGWYEEDCDWCIPVVVHHALSEELTKQLPAALKSFKNWYPDNYERFTGTLLKEGESRSRDKQVWNAARKGWWFGTCAWGDWNVNVPDGMVGVCMRVDADLSVSALIKEVYILVPAAEYAARAGNPYVVQNIETATVWVGPDYKEL